MIDWIPFEKGTYVVERAFLIAPNHSAVALEDAMVEVYQGVSGGRGIKGRGFVDNSLVVELLEECDDLDMVVDLGEGFEIGRAHV